MNITKEQLRCAFEQVISAAEQVGCEDLHHPLKHQHKDDERCKAEYHLGDQIHVLSQFMREQGVIK